MNVARRAASVLAVSALAATVACGTPSVPAQAAPAPVSRYDAGENPRDIGNWPSKTVTIDATWTHKRWPVEKVAKQISAQTGLNVRVCRVKRDLQNYSPCGDVTVSSDRSNHTGPTGKRLGEVSLWSEGNSLVSADVSLDDRDGKKASKAKRERKLRHYLTQAVGR